MTLRFAVVHEAEADFVTATELADRELVEAINDWLDAEQLAFQRTWLDTTPDGQRLRWTGLKRLADEAGVRAHGHFGGQPGLPDATAARRAILFLDLTMNAEKDELAAVLLIRDCDDEPERRGGLEQARTHTETRLPIVIGFAVVERESWAISGFAPQDESETARLERERQTLGFYPNQQSHQLTAAKDDQANRSPKRVLRVLTGGDWERQRRCWRETPLPLLRERGCDNGLAAYLLEVRERLAPLLGHVPTERPT